MIELERKKVHAKGKHKCFVSQENGCKHIGNNSGRDEVRQFKVDGDIFPKGEKPNRCDWLLLNDDKKKAYFIELKGSNIEYAISQIEESVKRLQPSIPSYKIYRRLIYRTGTHKIQGNGVVRWKSKHKGTAIIKERIYEENI